ncbi:FMN-binding negative transcriptional regulator [Pelagerythrobacter marinus]|uniref:FMN-binding negative transcriptional regulator n=1 Tax=Pelagerythrobacter marinus TaxID=538382 RepID=UPI002036B94C|nr:FMN-binding negative transcriptional regulator [Pelagerythrobacter marinus]USA41025.1 FMN-binding negative transcriptional regulator [Pelagerythrobacter marinus]WPZ07801.1 FMN-binding negative transcriptional regulator [Pelagerythrobacter marinus]
MTGAAHLYERFAPADVRALIEEYPLAWVVAGQGSAATTLPLIGEYDATGRLAALVGHFARGNPVEGALAADPRASLLFTGPQGYIPTDLAIRPDWAPTWNYARLQIDARVTITPADTAQAVDRLLRAMEGPGGWSVENLGPRYRAMIGRIVGFRAQVTRVRGRFKLGQDEDLPTLRSIIAGTPDRALARWMERLNAERLGPPVEGGTGEER